MAILINMLKFGYDFYVILRNYSILKQDYSYRNIIMKTVIYVLNCQGIAEVLFQGVRSIYNYVYIL
jgi:hypothetical protein